MEKTKIIFATGNEGKMNEIREIMDDFLSKYNIELLSLKDADIHADIVEDGSTFEENAIIKATEIAKLTGCMVLADDSGLEIDYMNGGPGIYSARFLGEDTSYDIKNNYIIDRLSDAKDEERGARFVCVIACAFPDGSVITERGTVCGSISKKLMGENGFGFDPIFYVPEYGCTTAELTPEKKNEISHRGRALKGMMKKLDSYFVNKNDFRKE